MEILPYIILIVEKLNTIGVIRIWPGPMSSKHDWSFDKILISELMACERVSYL